jgi:hypothetical protein
MMNPSHERKGRPAVDTAGSASIRAACLLVFFILVGACSQPGPNGGAVVGFDSVTAQVVGADVSPGDVMVAVDAVIGDTLLALGEVQAGTPATLTVSLASASSVPIDRLQPVATSLAGTCLPGTVQPEPLAAAFFFSVHRSGQPGRELALVTRTERPYPDLHVAILADRAGVLRGTCRFTAPWSLGEQVVTVDLTLDRGWNWVRVVPSYGADAEAGFAYTLGGMRRAQPASDAFWTDLLYWSPETNGPRQEP